MENESVQYTILYTRIGTSYEMLGKNLRLDRVIPFYELKDLLLRIATIEMANSSLISALGLFMLLLCIRKECKDIYFSNKEKTLAKFKWIA